MNFWILAGYVAVGLVTLAVVLTFIMALSSKAGRDALAVIGVRVADALVKFFERWLSKQNSVRRAMICKAGVMRIERGRFVSRPWWKE